MQPSSAVLSQHLRNRMHSIKSKPNLFWMFGKVTHLSGDMMPHADHTRTAVECVASRGSIPGGVMTKDLENGTGYFPA